MRVAVARIGDFVQSGGIVHRSLRISGGIRLARIIVASLVLAGVLPHPAAVAVTTESDHVKAEKAVSALFSKDVVLSAAEGGGGGSAALRALDADDTIPGSVSLPGSPFSRTLDFVSDPTDVYTVPLAAGTRLTVLLQGPAQLSCEAYLYDPFVLDADVVSASAGTIGDTYPKMMTFDVPAGAGGDYHLAIDAWSGSGTYTVTYWSCPVPSGPDDDIPGVLPTVSPIADTLDAMNDRDDVYRVALAADQRLVATLNGPATADFDVYLYSPGAGSIALSLPMGGSAGPSSSESYVFDVPAGQAGVYYLVVHCASGSGPYSLSWSVSAVPAGVWETRSSAAALGASSGIVNGSLDRLADRNDFYALALAAGDRLVLTLNGQDGTDFDVYAYDAKGSLLAYTDDSKYPEKLTIDVGASGMYYVEVSVFAGAGWYSLGYETCPTPAFSSTERLAGLDRYKTSVAISRTTFEAGSCPTVVIATGEDFPDALSASGLAGVYDCPILLTRKSAIPPDVMAELDRLGAEKVVLIGGTPTLPEPLADAFRAAGYGVSRIAGANRYSTSAAVAREIGRLKGVEFAGVAFVARGDVFADALALSPFAYSREFPVLLTRTDALATECSSAITALGINEVYVAGSTSAVSAGVVKAIDALPAVTAPVVRLYGSDRYATAAAIAEHGLAAWWGDPSYIGVATGVNFPDALGGGAAAGHLGGIMLLTKPDSLSASAGACISEHRGAVVRAQVYGGNTTVTDKVVRQVDALLN